MTIRVPKLPVHSEWEVKTPIGIVTKHLMGGRPYRYELPSLGMVSTDPHSDAFRLLQNLCAVSAATAVGQIEADKAERSRANALVEKFRDILRDIEDEGYYLPDFARARVDQLVEEITSVRARTLVQGRDE